LSYVGTAENFERDVIKDELVIPEFRMKGEIGCPNTRTDGVCSLVNANDDVPIIQRP